MVRATSERVGRGTCLGCGEGVTYRRTSGGMLKAVCDCCDLSMFAPKGTAAERKALATIKEPAPAPEPAPKGEDKPAPEPSPEPTPKPAPKGVRSVFEMGL